MSIYAPKPWSDACWDAPSTHHRVGAAPHPNCDSHNCPCNCHEGGPEGYKTGGRVKREEPARKSKEEARCLSCKGPDPQVGGPWEGYCEDCVSQGHALEDMREGAAERRAEAKMDKARSKWMGFIADVGKQARHPIKTARTAKLQSEKCAHCTGEGCYRCQGTGWAQEPRRGTYMETKPEIEQDKPRHGYSIKEASFGVMDIVKARGKRKIKSKKGRAKVERTMHEWGQGELHSGSKEGPVVESQKQAIAIALNQARKKGYKSRAELVADSIFELESLIKARSKPRFTSGNPSGNLAAGRRKRAGRKSWDYADELLKSVADASAKLADRDGRDRAETVARTGMRTTNRSLAFSDDLMKNLGLMSVTGTGNPMPNVIGA